MIRKILILLLINFQFVFSQNKLPEHKTQKNHTIFIGGHLASFKVFIEKGLDIKKISVINTKEDEINDIPKEHEGSYFTDYKTNKTDLYTQSELNNKYKLKHNTDIYYDGYLIRNIKYTRAQFITLKL